MGDERTQWVVHVRARAMNVCEWGERTAVGGAALHPSKLCCTRQPPSRHAEIRTATVARGSGDGTHVGHCSKYGPGRVNKKRKGVRKIGPPLLTGHDRRRGCAASQQCPADPPQSTRCLRRKQRPIPPNRAGLRTASQHWREPAGVWACERAAVGACCKERARAPARSSA